MRGHICILDCGMRHVKECIGFGAAKGTDEGYQILTYAPNLQSSLGLPLLGSADQRVMLNKGSRIAARL